MAEQPWAGFYIRFQEFYLKNAANCKLWGVPCRWTAYYRDRLSIPGPVLIAKD